MRERRKSDRKRAELTVVLGLAGTVLVHKLAGAAAESGLSLSEVTRIAKSAAARK
jgi:dihydroxyacetone kinase